jgi:GYF domain 2
MSDDPGAIDQGWEPLPKYGPGDGDDAVTLSISTTPGEWLVNTSDAVVVPMSMIEVVDALRAQRLTASSLVWRSGMQEWAPVQKVPQLMLAARLPSLAPPPSSGQVRPTNVTKPPPKPTRSSPAALRTPLPAPPSSPHRHDSVPRTSQSRKATLPFGLPPQHASPSRPLHDKPTPRPALPPPAPEDAEVLAVYDRPVATISFDLVQEAPTRGRSAEAPAQPQTLAPTTTDSARRRSPVPPPRRADASVVAARDFRQAQRSSKQLLLLSSVGSAAVASLLTLWLSRGAAQPHSAAPPAPVQVLAPAAPPPPPVVALPVPEPVAASTPSAEPSAKPKAKRKVRAWKPPARAAQPAAEVVDGAAPQAEANPYDVQLDEDDTATAKPPSASHGSGLESERVTREETATAAPTSPGF